MAPVTLHRISKSLLSDFVLSGLGYAGSDRWTDPVMFEIGLQTYRSQSETPFAIVDVHEQVIEIAASGAEITRHSLAPSLAAEEQFRSLRLGDDGVLYQLHLDDQGATLWRVTP